METAGNMNRAARLALLAALALLVAGCSHLSVRHLTRQPWVLNTEQQLDMRFWRFDFAASSRPGEFGVRGKAYPRSDEIPASMRQVEDLWLAAYLCDATGRVLAKDLAFYEPRTLDYESGVEFHFVLKPKDVEPGPLFITFGYRMVLSPGRTEEGGRAPDSSNFFFASEGALTRL